MHALLVPSERNMLTRMAVIAAVALLSLGGLGGCPRPDTMMNDNASNDNGAQNQNTNDSGQGVPNDNSNDNGVGNDNANTNDNTNANDNTNVNTNTNDNVNTNDNTNANDNGNSNGNVNSNANDNGPVTMPIVGTFSGTISCVKTEDSNLTNPATFPAEIRTVTVTFDATGQPVSVHIENLDNFGNPDFDANIQVAGEMDSTSGDSGMHLYMTTATVATADYADNSLSMNINLGYTGNRTTGVFIENGSGTQTVDFMLAGDALTYHFFTTWHMDATTGFGPFSLDQTFDCTGTLMRQ